MSEKIRNINFSTNLSYRDEYNEYEVRMVRRKFPWWIFLCLLPLLLLIECKHDIKVFVYEEDTKATIADVDVDLQYTSHFLFKDKQFFNDIPIEMTESTNDDGIAVFKDCPCSVFSYIFYCLSKATFTCTTDCHSSNDAQANFHYSWNVDLPMTVRREDLSIRVKDKESEDLLPDALVIYRYRENGKECIDSTRTDAGGVAVLKQMRVCSQIDEITASLYGYADTLRREIPCQNLLVPSDSTDLRLRRIKDQIEFYVKDVESKQPIPEADCLVKMTYRNEVVERNVKTSIDGKGRGVYDDAFLLYTVWIKASKQHYSDSTLQGGPYIVDKFNDLDTLKRTIWLRPLPYKVDFINTDSITGKPIPNVRNTIIITDKDGNERSYTETSNSNGIFPVVAKGNESVVIISERNPEYWNKRTEIDRFSDADKKVPMRPKIQEVNFKTVKDADNYPLLPNCQLRVTGTVSGSLGPTDSGNGEFIVRALIFENLTINASKNGYSPNNHTVNTTPVSTLMNKTTTPIPLKDNPIVYNYDKAIQGPSKDCYDLMEAGREIMFSWKVCPQCTMLIVTDGNGNELKRLGRDDPNGNGGGIKYSDPSGSITIKVPTQNVCVRQVNVNGHRCEYTIKRL